MIRRRCGWGWNESLELGKINFSLKKKTFNNHKPTYEELQTGSILLLKAVILWLSEFQWCELNTKKHKLSSCSFKQNLFATNKVCTNCWWVSCILAIIGSGFVCSEELSNPRWITLSEICIILQIILSLIQ